MKGGSAARAGAFLLTASAVAAGCGLVTDLGTSGYQLAQADACTPSPDASPDAACAPAATIHCASTMDCPTEEICCLTFAFTQTLSAVPIYGCQPPPCNISLSAQLCTGDDDCEAGACTAYTCMMSVGPSQVIGICGTLPSSLSFCSQGP